MTFPVPTSARMLAPTHLHPGQFDRFDIADPVIAGLESARAAAFRAAESIVAAAQARAANTLETPLKNQQAARAYSRRKLAETLPALDAAIARGITAVANLEQIIATSLSKAATAWTFANATREHVRSLPDGSARVEFIMRDLRGDAQAASAVIGAPGYLSGLSDGQHAMLAEAHRRAVFPAEAARAAAITEGVGILTDGGQLFMQRVHAMFDDKTLGAAAMKEQAALDAERR
jgi:hypothetical protein